MDAMRPVTPTDIPSDTEYHVYNGNESDDDNGVPRTQVYYGTLEGTNNNNNNNNNMPWVHETDEKAIYYAPGKVRKAHIKTTHSGACNTITNVALGVFIYGAISYLGTRMINLLPLAGAAISPLAGFAYGATAHVADRVVRWCLNDTIQKMKEGFARTALQGLQLLLPRVIALGAVVAAGVALTASQAIALTVMGVVLPVIALYGVKKGGKWLIRCCSNRVAYKWENVIENIVKRTELPPIMYEGRQEANRPNYSFYLRNQNDSDDEDNL